MWGVSARSSIDIQLHADNSARRPKLGDAATWEPRICAPRASSLGQMGRRLVPARSPCYCVTWLSASVGVALGGGGVGAKVEIQVRLIACCIDLVERGLKGVQLIISEPAVASGERRRYLPELAGPLDGAFPTHCSDGLIRWTGSAPSRRLRSALDLLEARAQLMVQPRSVPRRAAGRPDADERRAVAIAPTAGCSDPRQSVPSSLVAAAGKCEAGPSSISTRTLLVVAWLLAACIERALPAARNIREQGSRRQSIKAPQSARPPLPRQLGKPNNPLFFLPPPSPPSPPLRSTKVSAPLSLDRPTTPCLIATQTGLPPPPSPTHSPPLPGSIIRDPIAACVSFTSAPHRVPPPIFSVTSTTGTPTPKSPALPALPHRRFSGPRIEIASVAKADRNR